MTTMTTRSILDGEEPEADRVGRIEVRGIDVIPEEDRHGSPRELFWVWLSSNTAFIYILLGGILVLLGLNLWQALLVAVVGNLAYALIGVVATAGPTAGTSTLMISRAQYGTEGNRISAFLSWFSLVAFEAVNLSIGAFALFALADFSGWHVGNGGKALLLALIVVVTFGTAILGHATVVLFQKTFAYGLAAAAILLFIFVIPHVHWSYAPKNPLHGGQALAMVLLGLTVILSGPLSWIPTPADYSRYLPRSSSAFKIGAFTTLGAIVPAIALTVLGVLAGTAVNMTDPQSSMKPLMPHWFYGPFLLVICGGSITNNVLGVYSSGLSLQTAGLRIPRYLAVLIDATLGTAMAVYAIFISNFLTTMQEFLQMMIFWYAPYTAILVVDVLLRRRQYDGAELHVRAGRYGAFNWRGLTALALGAATAALLANTPHWQGPIVTHLDGADLSALGGMIVAGAAYWLLEHTRIRAAVDQPIPALELG